jgi:hypothetical protein
VEGMKTYAIKKWQGLVLTGCLYFCGSVHAIVDLDSDGMSDIWEGIYHAGGLSPSADDDGDEQSNLFESEHGTNPLDSSSFLKIDAVLVHQAATVLRWNSIAGIEYRIERSTVLGNGTWTQLAVVTGLEGETSHIVSTGAFGFDQLNAFFRVRVVSDLPDLDTAVTGEVRQQDTDKDGVPDIDEWISGTNVLDKESHLRILETWRGVVAAVRWQTKEGKRYVLQRRESAGGSWMDQAVLQSASGNPVEIPCKFGIESVPEFRVQVTDVDTDGDGVTDWEEAMTNSDPKLPDTLGDGRGDRAALEERIISPSVIAVRAREAVANVTRMEDGVIEITRSGGLDEVVVIFKLTGSAVAGRDFVNFANGFGTGNIRTGTVTLSYGQDSLLLPIVPLPGAQVPLSESVFMTVTGSSDYELGSSAVQQINLVREVALNVRDFGAVGDGIVDDTGAVQGAINALVSSSEQNTLFFPSGVYRLNTTIPTLHTLNTSNHRILQMDATGQSARDMFFNGEEGAVLYSTVSPLRAKMLLVLADFRTLAFRDLSWEKDSIPLSKKNNAEPNGAAGVTVQQITGNRIESLTFDNCRFTNCHRAITLSTVEISVNGRLKNVAIRKCNIDNPYGSNTENGRSALGGGTQVYLTAWVERALYEQNFFSGGAKFLVDSAESPGGIYKDGAHFGSPLLLQFRDNVVVNMGVESIFQTNENTRLGITTVPFQMPEPDFESTVDALVNFEVFPEMVGQDVNIRSSLLSNLFRIVAIDENRKILTLMNLGGPGSIVAGGSVNPGVVFLQILDPTVAEINGNLIQKSLAGGIVTVARSRIQDNLILDCVIGINLYRDLSIPNTPATTGSIVQNNFILTADPRRFGGRTYGVFSWAPKGRISENIVLTPYSLRFSGIHTEGKDAAIVRNAVLSSKAAYTSYTSSSRSTGTSIGNFSGNVVFSNNLTSGFDVGVGPVQAHQGIPHYVIEHLSLNDQLPIDPVGLISE